MTHRREQTRNVELTLAASIVALAAGAAACVVAALLVIHTIG